MGMTAEQNEAAVRRSADYKVAADKVFAAAAANPVEREHKREIARFYRKQSAALRHARDNGVIIDSGFGEAALGKLMNDMESRGFTFSALADGSYVVKAPTSDGGVDVEATERPAEPAAEQAEPVVEIVMPPEPPEPPPPPEPELTVPKLPVLQSTDDIRTEIANLVITTPMGPELIDAVAEAVSGKLVPWVRAAIGLRQGYVETRRRLKAAQARLSRIERVSRQDPAVELVKARDSLEACLKEWAKDKQLLNWFRSNQQLMAPHSMDVQIAERQAKEKALVEQNMRQWEQQTPMAPMPVKAPAAVADPDFVGFATPHGFVSAEYPKYVNNILVNSAEEELRLAQAAVGFHGGSDLEARDEPGWPQEFRHIARLYRKLKLDSKGRKVK